MNKCQYAIQNSFSNQQELVCIKCKENSNPFVNESNDFIGKLHNVEILENQFLLKELLKNYIVECIEETSIFYNTEQNNTPIQNCEFYLNKIVNNKNGFFCIKCKIGYTGKTDLGFIQSCEDQIQDCDTTSRNSNLLLHYQQQPQIGKIYLSQLSSCYQCNNNKLPVLFLGIENQYTFYPYSLIETTPYITDQIPTDNHMQCLELNQEQFGLQQNDVFDSIPQNCAFVIYNVLNFKSGDINGGASILCAACKPGFQPVFQNGIIVQCLLISNCYLDSIQNIYFNQCGFCLTNFVWAWDSYRSTIDGSKCVGTLDSTCLSYSEEDSQCKFCKKNYYKNQDQQCETLTLPNCRTNQNYFSKLQYSDIGKDLSYNLIKAYQGNGCLMCENDGILLETSEKICFESSYLKKNILPDESNFIKGCQSYYIENNIFKCKICSGNSLINNINTLCINLNFDLQYCEIAQDSSTCNQCISSKVLVIGKCKNPEIPNCKNYQYNQPTQICQKCQTGFFLFENECKVGSIKDCLEYTTQISCQLCKEGSQLITLSSQQSYCFPIPIETNCKIFANTFHVLNMECQQCKNGYKISNDPQFFVRNICAGFHQIQNCETYHFVNNLSSSTLQCQSCVQGYYLFNSKCHSRINLDANCMTYQNDKDNCSQCRLGYFLSDNQQFCEEYPKGILGCEQYLDLELCDKCSTLYYLSENKCIILKDEEKIENCLYYSNPSTCQECKKNFFLEGNQCLQVMAMNCLSYKSPNECESCQNRYGLKQQNELLNCVMINDTNCQIYEQQHPFKCLQCITDYFPNDEGICQIVSKFIVFCEVYKNNETCQKCFKGKILSIDGTECISNYYLQSIIDQNCEDLQMTNDFQCVICSPGFYFDINQNCIPYQTNNLESGCLLADFNKNEVCLACRSGYYMDKQGLCINENPPLPEIEKNKNLLRICLMIFLMNFFQIILQYYYKKKYKIYLFNSTKINNQQSMPKNDLLTLKKHKKLLIYDRKSKSQMRIKDHNKQKQIFKQIFDENRVQLQTSNKSKNQIVQIKGEDYYYDLIGQGSYGNVFKVTNINTKKITCIKQIEIIEPKIQLKEVSILKSLKHPNIVAFIKHWTDQNSIQNYQKPQKQDSFEIIFDDEDQHKQQIQNNLFLEMEYCEGLSLDNYLPYQGKRLNEFNIFKIFSQLLRGVIYIHSQKIAHLDLHMKNVFVKNNQIKIGDFGLAQKIKGLFTKTRVQGTDFYVAPEIENSGICYLNSDVFSLGIILLELLMGFKTISEKIQIFSKFKKDFQIPKKILKKFPQLKNLLKKMLEKDPQKRILSKKILIEYEYTSWKYRLINKQFIILN